MPAQRDPASLDAITTRGLSLKRAGRFEEAVEVLLEVVTLAPERAAAWNDLGTVYGALRDTERALEAFERALTLDPSLLPLITVNRVQLHKELGALEARRDALHEQHEQDELSVDGLFELGWILRWQGQEALAKQVYGRFVERAGPEHRQLVMQLLPWLYQV